MNRIRIPGAGVKIPPCRLFALSLLMTLTWGCGPEKLYEQTYPLESEWSYAQPLEFQFEVTDSNLLYDIDLEIRHGTNYPFQNLYTRTLTRFPSGEELTQVLSLELMDRTGFWQGQCSGEKCRIRIPIQEKVFFQELGTYTLQVEQFTRTDSLPGVQSLTLEVVEVGSR